MRASPQDVDAELALKVTRVRNARDLESCAVFSAKALGFEYVDLSLVVPFASPGLHQVGVTTLPRDWIARYDELGYRRIDPILRQAKHGVGPIHWDQVDVATHEERVFMRDAAHHGLVFGVTFCTSGRRGAMSILTLAGGQPVAAAGGTARAGLSMRMRGHSLLLMETASRLVHPSGEQSNPNLLTERERDVLVLTMAGLKSEHIGTELNLSPRTVLFHIESAGQKLGVSGRHRILQRAITIGALDPVAHALERNLAHLFPQHSVDDVPSPQPSLVAPNLPASQVHVRVREPLISRTAAKKSGAVKRVEQCRWEQLRRRLGEFWLAYQPIVHLETAQMTGCEGLLRWDHPKHPDLKPADFIGWMEESRAISDMGAWVLREAIDQQAEWKRGGMNLEIAINVSIQQLQSKVFIGELEAIGRSTGTSSWKHVVLEVSERAPIEWEGEAGANLRRLREEFGMRIMLDDFGSGFGSLTNLTSGRVDGFKLDTALVSSLGSNPLSTRVVQQSIRMARDLGIKVICKGVETAQQRELLLAFGADLGQGFLFSEGVRSDQIYAYAARHSSKAA